MRLFILGLGYTAQHLARSQAGQFSSIGGVVREAAKAASLRAQGLDAHALEKADAAAQSALISAANRADAIVITSPPEADAAMIACLTSNPALRLRARHFVYLSTTGVYGDRQGGVVDFRFPPMPTQSRGEARLASEQKWAAIAAGIGARATALRIAGIYGPGRNVLRDLSAGQAKRIHKPGHVFNRIHVDDLVAILCAILKHEAPGPAYDAADAEPAPQADVVAYAAAKLGLDPPPLQDYDAALLGGIARGFWEECKRIAIAPTLEALALTLRYPTYREGLDALYAAGEGWVDEGAKSAPK